MDKMKKIKKRKVINKKKKINYLINNKHITNTMVPTTEKLFQNDTLKKKNP